ncbi:hypothetical protein NQ317_006521 [Molorchus minor]|uniref:Uncharacterized protein n=1 Tax=Molorchus minor TaxID=1323400 RepID=A0ABQ9IVQ3_9CUCU|nr:hypothetical protein NQ317_006521 [Molorchus minor]
MRRSIAYAQELLRVKMEEEQKMYSGFWGSIKYFFQGPLLMMSLRLKDRQKVPMYLEVSLQNIMDMFDITTEVTEREPGPATSTSTNNFDMSSDFKFHSHLKE